MSLGAWMVDGKDSKIKKRKGVIKTVFISEKLSINLRRYVK